MVTQEQINRLTPIIRARVSRRIRAAPLELEDQVQNVWLALVDRDYRQLRAYDPARGMSLENYVGMIAERETCNEARRLSAMRNSKRPVPGKTCAPRPDRTVLNRDLLSRVHDHLQERLPKKGLRIFHLLHIEHRSAAEAAEICGVAIQVIYNWQHRIRTIARRVT